MTMYSGRKQRHYWIGRLSAYQPETLIYFAAHPTMTPAEVAALDVEIKAIKYSTGIALTSVTLAMSFITGRYFITNSSSDLTRYAGISGVQYSVARTGTPGTTAVYSGTITAGSGETYTDIINGATLNGNMETGDPPSDWTARNGSTLSSVADERTGGSGSKSMNAVRGTANCVAGEITVDAGKLIKCTAWIKNIDATSVSFGNYNGDALPDGFSSTSTSWTTGTAYLTCDGSGNAVQLRVNGSAGQQGRFDDVVVRQVLTADTYGIQASSLTNAGINARSTSYVVTITKP